VINLFKEVGGCVAWVQNQVKSLCLAAIFMYTSKVFGGILMLLYCALGDAI
jgi:hypothetical protein